MSGVEQVQVAAALAASVHNENLESYKLIKPNGDLHLFRQETIDSFRLVNQENNQILIEKIEQQIAETRGGNRQQALISEMSTYQQEINPFFAPTLFGTTENSDLQNTHNIYALDYKLKTDHSGRYIQGLGTAFYVLIPKELKIESLTLRQDTYNLQIKGNAPIIGKLYPEDFAWGENFPANIPLLSFVHVDKKADDKLSITVRGGRLSDPVSGLGNDNYTITSEWTINSQTRNVAPKNEPTQASAKSDASRYVNMLAGLQFEVGTELTGRGLETDSYLSVAPGVYFGCNLDFGAARGVRMTPTLGGHFTNRFGNTILSDFSVEPGISGSYFTTLANFLGNQTKAGFGASAAVTFPATSTDNSSLVVGTNHLTMTEPLAEAHVQLGIHGYLQQGHLIGGLGIDYTPTHNVFGNIDYPEIGEFTGVTDTKSITGKISVSYEF